MKKKEKKRKKKKTFVDYKLMIDISVLFKIVLLQKYSRRASILTMTTMLADNLKGLTRLKYITYVIFKPLTRPQTTAKIGSR